MGIFDKIFGKQKSKQPEDDYKIIITEDLILVEHPRRKTEQVLWKNIVKIKFLNTDEGPWLPDVWLALMGKEDGCLISLGAESFDEVYEIVSKYEGFNFENAKKSITCSDNAEFLLWQSKKYSRKDWTRLPNPPSQPNFPPINLKNSALVRASS